jgi:hypothetical protein
MWVMAGCEADDPEARGGTQCEEASDAAWAPCVPDLGTAPRDNESCVPLPTDYRPREQGSVGDGWPACISDDNQYHPFNASVGSNARVAAFEEIAALLGFDGSKVPTCQDYLLAKVAWAQPEGLQSRVARREDVHYPAPTKGGQVVRCRDLSKEELLAHADRCAGPYLLQPLIESALNEGAMGREPLLNAARVEAGLLWFFAISLPKELQTCGTEDREDCDSATGYYAGTQSRQNPIGLGRYVRARSPQAHERVWDGLLAARCWRDLDPGMPHANPAMMMQAVEQTDRAVLRGVALIVRSRVQNAHACPFAQESVRVLGPLLLRAARQAEPATAAVLEAEVTRADLSQLDAAAATSALDVLFPCP